MLTFKPLILPSVTGTYSHADLLAPIADPILCDTYTQADAQSPSPLPHVAAQARQDLERRIRMYLETSSRTVHPKIINFRNTPSDPGVEKRVENSGSRRLPPENNEPKTGSILAGFGHDSSAGGVFHAGPAKEIRISPRQLYFIDPGRTVLEESPDGTKNYLLSVGSVPDSTDYISLTTIPGAAGQHSVQFKTAATPIGIFTFEDLSREPNTVFLKGTGIFEGFFIMFGTQSRKWVFVVSKTAHAEALPLVYILNQLAPFPRSEESNSGPMSLLADLVMLSTLEESPSASSSDPDIHFFCIPKGRVKRSINPDNNKLICLSYGPPTKLNVHFFYTMDRREMKKSTVIFYNAGAPENLAFQQVYDPLDPSVVVFRGFDAFADCRILVEPRTHEIAVVIPQEPAARASRFYRFLQDTCGVQILSEVTSKMVRSRFKIPDLKAGDIFVLDEGLSSEVSKIYEDSGLDRRALVYTHPRHKIRLLVNTYDNPDIGFLPEGCILLAGFSGAASYPLRLMPMAADGSLIIAENSLREDLMMLRVREWQKSDACFPQSWVVEKGALPPSREVILTQELDPDRQMRFSSAHGELHLDFSTSERELAALSQQDSTGGEQILGAFYSVGQTDGPGRFRRIIGSATLLGATGEFLEDGSIKLNLPEEPTIARETLEKLPGEEKIFDARESLRIQEFPAKFDVDDDGVCHFNFPFAVPHHICGFSVILPPTEGLNIAPREINAILKEEGQEETLLPMSFFSAHSTSGNARSCLHVVATLRVGAIRFTVRLERAMYGWGDFKFSRRVRCQIAQILNYEELYKDWDEYQLLQAMLHQTLSEKWPKYPAFPTAWTSPSFANWRDYVALTPTSGQAPDELAIAIRLGDQGQSKLKLAEGQQIFLRFSFAPNTEREFTYFWRGGFLEPWREQAPPGKIRVEVKDGILILSFDSGLLKEAFERAYTLPLEPEIKFVFTPDLTQVLGFAVDGNEWLCPQGENTRDTLSAALDSTLESLLQRAQEDYGRPVIDYVAPKKPEPKSVAKPAELVRAIAQPTPQPTLRPTPPPSPPQVPALPDKKPAMPKVLKKLQVASSDEFLPPLLLEGEWNNPTSLTLSDVAVARSVSLVVMNQDPTTVTLLVEFGASVFQEIQITQTELGLSYTRLDSEWAEERGKLVQEKITAAKREERHWCLVTLPDGQNALFLKNGLDESVLDDRRQVIRLPLFELFGRRFIVDLPQARNILKDHNQPHTGFYFEILSVEPLEVLALDSFSPDFLPLRSGNRVPLLELVNLYATADITRQLDIELSEHEDDVRRSLTASPIFLPSSISLSKLIPHLARSSGSLSISLNNERGDTLIVSLTRTPQAWGWGDSPPILKVAGAKSGVPIHGAQDKIGGEESLRWHDGEGRLLWDLRIGWIFGIPCVYGAHQIDSIKSLTEHVMDRVTLLAALSNSYEDPSTAVWQPVFFNEVYDDARGIYSGETRLKNGESGHWTLTYQRDDHHLIVGTEGLEGSYIEDNKDPQPRSLQLFLDRRTNALYGLSGPINQPKEVFEIQWIAGRGPRLIPLSRNSWLRLKTQQRNNQFLDYLLAQERSVAKTRALSRNGQPTRTNPQPVWSGDFTALPDTEKFPFLFSTQESGLEPIEVFSAKFIARLKGEIFKPAPQNFEDMIFGKPPLDTRTRFHFIGSRGDFLELDMVYSQFEGHDGQTVVGWVLHPSSHARNEEVGVTINGARIKFVEYHREQGGSQVIRFGLRGQEVTLRYFSMDNTFFGFREGVATTKHEGLLNYAKARASLQHLLEVSRALEGCFEIAADTIGASSPLTTWLLAKGSSRNITTVEISYRVEEQPDGLVTGSLSDPKHITLNINSRPVVFDVYKVPGRQSLFLRQAGQMSTEPLRFLLKMRDDGKPALRQVSQAELDLTEAYLDVDVWPSGFVPVFRFGIKRKNLAIMESATLQEWHNRLMPPDDPRRHATNVGFLTWAHTYFDSNLSSAYRAAKLIARDPEALAVLRWNTASQAIHRQNKEYFSAQIRLAGRHVVERGLVIFAAELEANAIFEGFKGWQIERIMRSLAEPHGAIQRTECGNAVVIRARAQNAEASILSKLSQLQATQSNLYGQVQLDARISPDDDRRQLDFIADIESLNGEEIVINAELRTQALKKLKGQNRQLLELFFAGYNLYQIAAEIGLTFEVVDETYDEAMNELLEILADEE